ncbi:MAG: DNA topoisomerase 1 [Phycisphaerae bacterium]|nr:DNA topoisomerase 1 [Phycisphaerae bacterium]
MAKKASAKKKTKKKASSRSSTPSAAGKQLVIVESPAKAKTINRYLGPEFIVTASVGHIRDLPSKAPKGSKQPVPGVDLENDFEPSYEVLTAKKKTVTDLKKAAKGASQIWFATDLDREGEAIAWHLAELLGVKPKDAKRVVFNAITKGEIERAFETPHPIDEYKVNAQQARRILDRIVGYQASPLLWKKVARGLSAGRVQSVATRLIVEREREIDAFIPDESWDVGVKLALDPTTAPGLVEGWSEFISELDDKGRGPTIKRQNGWLSEHGGLRTELVELGGEKFSLGCSKDAIEDLSTRISGIAEGVGLSEVSVDAREDPDGKGPARQVRTVSGVIAPDVRYAVDSIDTTRKSSKPFAPYITSSLQVAASNVLGFTADRTMRIAQQLYMGLDVPGEGQVGLITYMRTDSTHLSGDAIGMARGYIEERHGGEYLPEKPRFYGSSNKDAQEAHEAIRPTDPRRTPDQVKSALSEEQLKLYRLIWNRFVSCQMTDAKWDSTAVRFRRADQDTGAILRATGRVLAFDGWTRVGGVAASDEQVLPAFADGDQTAPFSIEPRQKFSSPPPRYNEGSLVKKLEDEGIGRPSTYASIIKVIQDRGYAEKVGKAFHATALGEVVTDKMVEAFPRLMDFGYTRELEKRLDEIEEEHVEWKVMLRDFYGRFSESLERAHEELGHAKAEIQPAPYACPKCASKTCYRFGKNGRFLSCTAYPDCDYAAPIDRAGRPLLPEMVDIKCPEDGSQMILRTGRFGKYMASQNYPEVKFVLNLDRKDCLKLPAPPAFETDLKCSKCEDRNLYLRDGKRGPWLGCSGFPKCRGRESFAKLDEPVREKLEADLKKHLKANPMPVITDMKGTPIKEGTPIVDLVVPGLIADLAIHPESVADTSPRKAG